jgi:3,4-dihydroxy 2-butanone 4-phosphate synthase / GTP cyclohydrolase II
MPITQSTVVPLKYGSFRISYHQQKERYCVSVAYGDLTNRVPIVRIHSACLFSEAFHGLLCDCAAQLTSTLKLIKKNKSGVVVYQFMEGRGVGLEAKIKALELQRTQKINTVEAFRTLGFAPDLREYGNEIDALRDLKMNKNVKLASQNPRKAHALREAGFTLVEQVHPLVNVTKYNVQELLTKRDLLGYTILTDLSRYSDTA